MKFKFCLHGSLARSRTRSKISIMHFSIVNSLQMFIYIFAVFAFEWHNNTNICEICVVLHGACCGSDRHSYHSPFVNLRIWNLFSPSTSLIADCDGVEMLNVCVLQGLQPADIVAWRLCRSCLGFLEPRGKRTDDRSVVRIKFHPENSTICNSPPLGVDTNVINFFLCRAVVQEPRKPVNCLAAKPWPADPQICSRTKLRKRSELSLVIPLPCGPTISLSDVVPVTALMSSWELS